MVRAVERSVLAFTGDWRTFGHSCASLSFPTMKILVIDDDQMILQFIQRGLTEEGYTVDVAASGQEGAMFARMSSYDAIILDLMLPDMSGFDIDVRLGKE